MNGHGLNSESLFERWPHEVTSATIIKGGKRLQVGWSDGSKDEYPLVWLRFNCKCNECYNQQARSRRAHSLLFTSADSVNIEKDVRSIQVEWSSGHSSVYSFNFLGQRSFRKEQIEMRNEKMMYKRLPCEFETTGMRLERFDFNEVIGNDETFILFAEHVLKYGACILFGSPENAYEVLSHKRNMPLRMCHYGETWKVTTKISPSNLAYTGKALGLHVDLPFLVTQVEIQLLHCLIASTSGGYSILSDGLMAAKRLQTEYPEYFNVLTKKYVDHFDIGVDTFGEFFTASRRPIIELHDDGSVRNFIASPSAISDFSTESLEDTELWYTACNKLFEIAKQHQMEFRIEAGDVLVFDNLRALHGRSQFQPSATTSTNRLLRGWYFDWESVTSTMRCCKARLNAGEA